jgi:hypothetical protein
MLMAGNVQYSQIEGYREITCDFEKDTADLICEEVKFHEEGSDIFLLMKLRQLGEFWKKEELSADDLYYLVLHSDKYKKYSSSEKKQVECEPSEFERLMLDFFKTEEGKEYLSGKTYTGVFNCHSNKQALRMAAKDSTVVFQDFLEVEEPNLLKDFTVKARGGWNKGVKVQTEKEKLSDRVAFLLEQTGLTDCKNLIDLIAVQEEITSEQKAAIELAKEIIGLR